MQLCHDAIECTNEIINELAPLPLQLHVLGNSPYKSGQPKVQLCQFLGVFWGVWLGPAGNNRWPAKDYLSINSISCVNDLHLQRKNWFRVCFEVSSLDWSFVLSQDFVLTRFLNQWKLSLAAWESTWISLKDPALEIPATGWNYLFWFCW